MYSKDRFKALGHTISCLQRMKEYDNCQKTLIFDGQIDSVPQDWDHVQVPRKNGEFCWARMWDAGVCTARNEKILYLDSDRLLPSNYLRLILDQVKDNIFAFTSKHYMMAMENTTENYQRFIESNDPISLLNEPEFLGMARFEPRAKNPLHQSGKNVMSGSTAFTRKTYLSLGGVDHWYCGHGAFADTDFHMQAAVSGCQFVDLSVNELHYIHPKLDNNQKAMKNEELHSLSLTNYIYYCDKWKLPMSLAEAMAQRMGIKKPSSYVETKLKELPRNR